MALTCDLFLLTVKTAYDLKQRLVNYGPQAKPSLLPIFVKNRNEKMKKIQQLYWKTAMPFAVVLSMTAFVLWGWNGIDVTETVRLAKPKRFLPGFYREKKCLPLTYNMADFLSHCCYHNKMFIPSVLFYSLLEDKTFALDSWVPFHYSSHFDANEVSSARWLALLALS